MLPMPAEKPPMDRSAWLAQRRAAVEAQFDAESGAYDAEGGAYPTPLHRSFIERLTATTPAGGVVLDAACGTGKWFAAVVEAGRRVVGVDQSAGMLAQARAKGLAERVERVGLQELPFESEFDAAMVIDAMENVSPEDWPLVARNLARALKPGGHLFLTLEEQEEADVDEAFRQLTASGQPAVRGEVTEGDVAGYHFYPGRAQALAWLADAGFELVAEDYDDHGDWGYRLLLLRRSA
jgi:ubiquinone/menaquinone biosynthesis C-methylase UbiE